MEPENNANPLEDENQDVEQPHAPPRSTIRSAIGVAMGLAAATGTALFLLTSVSVGGTRGATRSYRLQWQERQVEIDAQIVQEDIEGSSSPESKSAAE